MTTLIRLPRLLSKSGASRSTIYERIQKGTLTKPVAIGARAVAWPEHEIDAILRAQIAGKPEAEIKALVVSLEAARKDAA